MTAIRVDLSKGLHKRLKIRAVEEDMTLQAMVRVALDAYLVAVAKGSKVSKV